MNDLDKMAGGLLAGELARDGWAGELAAALLADRPDDARVSGDMALAAIRAALLAAPPGYVLVDRATLLEMRDVAMRWTRSGRLPECGAFSRIAQDADAMLAAAPEVKR